MFGKSILIASLLILTSCATWNAIKNFDLIEDEPIRDEWISDIAGEGMAWEKDSTLINNVNWYSVNWMGLHVGDLFADLKFDKGVYRLRVVTRASGFAWFISNFQGDSMSLFKFDGDKYKPLVYTTSYQLRKKRRTIRLEYAPDGSILKEKNIPKENHLKRPPVHAEYKKNTWDPLLIAFVARKEISDSIASGSDRFTLPLYNGRSRSDIHFTIHGRDNDGRIKVSFTQEAVDGQTQNELREMRERQSVIELFLDPDSLMPIFGRGNSKVGTATIKFEQTCATLAECVEQ